MTEPLSESELFAIGTHGIMYEQQPKLAQLDVEKLATEVRRLRAENERLASERDDALARVAGMIVEAKRLQQSLNNLTG